MQPPAIARRCTLLLPIAALLVAAACGDDDAGPATPTASPAATVTATPIAPSPTPTASPASTPFQGTRGPVEKKGAAPVPPGALLVDVRTGRHDTFDRVVFEFDHGLPGYRIEYVQPPILGEFSGEPVDIAGNAFLRVNFRMAAAHDPSTGEPTYTGPLEIVSRLPSLLELERTGDFEGQLTWVLGLTEEVDFRVFELEDPFRVAIDVKHP